LQQKNRVSRKDLNPSAARLSFHLKTRRFPSLPHGRIGFVEIVLLFSVILKILKLNEITSHDDIYYFQSLRTNRTYVFKLGNGQPASFAFGYLLLCGFMDGRGGASMGMSKNDVRPGELEVWESFYFATGCFVMY